MNSLSGAIRELSLSASGFYVGGTAHITLGRLLGSAFPGPQTSSETTATSNAGSSPSAGNGNFINVPMFSEPNVEILFKAYIKYVAPEYPIIHSRGLRDMHARRNMLYVHGKSPCFISCMLLQEARYSWYVQNLKYSPSKRRTIDIYSADL
jgi:hypothetical protein